MASWPLLVGSGSNRLVANFAEESITFHQNMVLLVQAKSSCGQNFSIMLKVGAASGTSNVVFFKKK